MQTTSAKLLDVVAALEDKPASGLMSPHETTNSKQMFGLRHPHFLNLKKLWLCKNI